MKKKELPPTDSQSALTVANKVEIDIYGERYLIAANSAPDYIRQLAQEVDSRARNISTANPQLSSMRTMVLALLGLAEDVISTQKLVDEKERMLAARCEEIEREIERLLEVA